ncbi:50S ribosomal protein L21 [Flavimarina sp. Hel_I_48]|uniref:50S ribosomal protein L21 n=1 Tax=Flavimarina sp. Hel_I_48 TaxID=1392488 RepID=UPI0004DF3E3E|nr:50S ribosomal protein L21 [Flavimarina sp. Hel_I_48]
MYAIVEIAGQQFKVAKDQKIYVNRLAEDEGANVSFDKVLLADDNGNVTLGAPAIDGALVGAKVVKHLRGDKVIVFKKKRRKGYKKKNGHRQSLTQLEIVDISLSGKKKESKKEDSKKTEAAKDASKKESKTSENQASDANGFLKNIGTAKKEDADNLKEINGIGPAYEKRLNEVGIFTYEQISKLKEADMEELSSIDGITREKIESDEWVKQAKALLKN